MLNFRKTEFVKSCTSRKQSPEKFLPEIVFIGKSNVGKSSLINAICDNKNLAFTSSKPGHTRLLNYFNTDNKAYIVDAPGYGYSKAGQKHTILFGEMMEDYFANDKAIAIVCYLLDSRRVPNEEDIDFYYFLKENNLPFVVVMTKCDKLNQSERAKIMKNLTTTFEDLDKSKVILTTIKDKVKLDDLRKVISSYVK